MKKFVAMLPVFALLTAMIVGCGGEEGAGDGEGDTETGHNSTAADTTNVAYCGQCGDAAGSEDCCAEGAEVCTDCDFHKGSALCCSGVAKVEGEYCACGHEKGTDDCCSEEGELCECGFHKGSALCCKVKGEEKEAGDEKETN